MAAVTRRAGLRPIRVFCVHPFCICVESCLLCRGPHRCRAGSSRVWRRGLAMCLMVRGVLSRGAAELVHGVFLVVMTNPPAARSASRPNKNFEPPMHTDGAAATASAPLARVGVSLVAVNRHAGLGPSVCIGVHRWFHSLALPLAALRRRWTIFGCRLTLAVPRIAPLPRGEQPSVAGVPGYRGGTGFPAIRHFLSRRRCGGPQRAAEAACRLRSPGGT